MTTLPIELTAAAFGVAGTILLGVWVWLVKPRVATGAQEWEPES